MTITAAFLNGTYPAAQVRQAILGGPMAAQATGVVPRPGVITGPPNALQVAASGGMTVSVQPGYAILPGGYEVIIDAQETKTIDPATTTARWDVVGLRVYDQEQGDGAPSRAEVWVNKGSTTAEAPLPAGGRFLPLARVVVGASVSSINSGNITDRRTYTAAAGGIIPAAGAIGSTPNAQGFGPMHVLYDPVSETLLIPRANGTEFARPGITPEVSSAQAPVWVISSGAPEFTSVFGPFSQRAGVSLAALAQARVVGQTDPSSVWGRLWVDASTSASGPWNTIGDYAGWASFGYLQEPLPGARGIVAPHTADRSIYIRVRVTRIGGSTAARVDMTKVTMSPVAIVTGF